MIERGKIVLAEFGYGERRLPAFLAWLIDGSEPSASMDLEAEARPPICWRGLLKGREWRVAPEIRSLAA